MIRISLAFIYDLAAKLEPLGKFEIKDIEFGDVVVPLFEAQIAMSNIQNSLFRPYMRTCLRHYGDLAVDINRCVKNIRRKISFQDGNYLR